MNRYSFVCEIGYGSYGKVYKAVDRRDKRVVAIKVVEGNCLNEIDLMKKFNGPSFVEFYEDFRNEKNKFIVQEYCSHGNICRLKKFANERIALSIIKEVSKSLLIIHSNGYIHMDVKPQNILISRIGEIKLGDFGIAK